MSKLLADQIANYDDNGPIEIKEGLNIASGKPLQVAGSAGSSGNVLVSSGTTVSWSNALDNSGNWDDAHGWGNHAAAGYSTTDTNTTYVQSSVADGSNVNLRLTAGGSGSGNDDILLTAGTNVTFSSVTAGGFTIDAASGGTPANLGINATNRLLYQVSNTDTDILAAGTAGEALTSGGDGVAPSWSTVGSTSQSTSNGINGINLTNNTSGANANAIEIQTDNNTASAVRWRFTPPGHLLPSSNADYDIGSAEYKVRHLFLSDNTLYFEGSFLKVAQHDNGGSAQTASYLIPLAKLKDTLNASADYEAFKTAILAITDA